LTGSIGRETSGLYDFAMAFRQPLRESCFSETREGFKVAPLLGLENWDGGVTMVLFNPFTQIFLSNDHATMFSFFPKGPLETVIRIWWLVAGKAEAGVDYNVDDITYMWTVTTEQDRDLVEANQAGVSSHRFRRGRYSEMEKGPIMLLNWYVNQMRDAGAGH
jgi:Rieske 2Fe-2S family protein